MKLTTHSKRLLDHTTAEGVYEPACRNSLREFFSVPLHPVLWISLLALPFFFLNLGSPALTDAEAMYAEIAREMHALGDWITPHLNGTPHFDKPPLIYWLIGLSQLLLGENELSARIWTALAAWGTIPIVGAIGATIYGARAGWMAAVVFATSLGPFIFARLTMPDPILTFWIALAILGYVRSYRQDRTNAAAWPWVMYTAVGLAILTKGILGIALPAAIIGLDVLLRRRLRVFLSWRLAAGICFVAVIAMPWHMAAAKENIGFLEYFFIREHFLRFTGARFPPDEFVPLPVFLCLTALWTLPWLALMPQAVVRGVLRLNRTGLRNGADLLPILWLAIIITLFSASRSRLEYYSLPAFPAFALLMGKLWDDLLACEPGKASSRSIFLSLAAMSAITALAALFALLILGPYRDLLFQSFIKWWPTSGWAGYPAQADFLKRIRFPTILTLIGTAVITLSSLIAVYRSRIGLAFGIIAGMMVPIFPMVHWGFLLREPFASSRPIAQIFQETAGPKDLVVYQEPHEYMWVGGITFYMKHRVHILKDPDFNGLAERPRKPEELFLDDEQLKALWSSSKHVFLVAEARGNPIERLCKLGPMDVLGVSGSKVILTNNETTPAQNETGEDFCARP